MKYLIAALRAICKPCSSGQCDLCSGAHCECPKCH